MTNGNRPPELEAILDDLEQGEPFASIEDEQRAMDAQMRGYNSRPQADLGGLSPIQLYELLYGDWKSTRVSPWPRRIVQIYGLSHCASFVSVAGMRQWRTTVVNCRSGWRIHP